MRHLRITIGNKSYEVVVEDLTEGEHFPGAALPQRIVAQPPSAQSARESASRPQKLAQVEGAVLSPMAGAIQTVHAKAGDRIQKGQLLVVLEAMKMENHIVAPDDGSIKSVDVQAGQTVHEGQLLLVLE